MRGMVGVGFSVLCLFLYSKGRLNDMYKKLKERERIRKKVQDKFEASDSAFFLLAR